MLTLLYSPMDPWLLHERQSGGCRDFFLPRLRVGCVLTLWYTVWNLPGVHQGHGTVGRKCL